MRARSIVLGFVVAGLAMPLVARAATAQYTMDRHPAVATDSAGAAVLRAVRADLAALRAAQDSFFVVHGRYSADTSAFHEWKPTSGALILIQSADSTGWVAAAAHRQLVGMEILTIRRAQRPLSRP